MVVTIWWIVPCVRGMEGEEGFKLGCRFVVYPDVLLAGPSVLDEELQATVSPYYLKIGRRRYFILLSYAKIWAMQGLYYHQGMQAGLDHRNMPLNITGSVGFVSVHFAQQTCRMTHPELTRYMLSYICLVIRYHA